MPEEAQGRTLLEREVNGIVRAGFEVFASPPCACGHPAAHHDGFGCAEVEGPYTERCGCENYKPKAEGTVSDAEWPD